MLKDAAIFYNKNQLVIKIWLQPQSKRDLWGDEVNGRIKLKITAPPVDGKANRYLIRFLAKEFQCKQQNICIKKGALTRFKTVVIDHPYQLPKVLEIYINNSSSKV